MTSLDCESETFCVVIPAYNEASKIAAVVRKCKSICLSVLVVDDGSVDATADLAANYGALVLRLERNHGLGNALRTGFRRALNDGYAHVVTLDGDDVHDPRDITYVIRHHISEGCDLTLGSRAGNDGTFGSLPSPKAAANRIAQLTLNLVFGTTISDWLTGFRVLRRSFLEHDFSSSDYSIAIELVYRAVTQKRKIGEVPISARYDAEELYALKRRELEDFLRFCYRTTRNSVFVETLERVGRMGKLRIEIRGERYIAHPIPDYHGYIIQQQEYPDGNADSEAFWIRFDSSTSVGYGVIDNTAGRIP